MSSTITKPVLSTPAPIRSGELDEVKPDVTTAKPAETPAEPSKGWKTQGNGGSRRARATGGGDLNQVKKDIARDFHHLTRDLMKGLGIVGQRIREDIKSLTHPKSAGKPATTGKPVSTAATAPQPKTPATPFNVPMPPSLAGVDLKDPAQFAKYQGDLSKYFNAYVAARDLPDNFQVQRDASGKVQLPAEPNPRGLNFKDPNVRLQFMRDCTHYAKAAALAQSEGQAVPPSNEQNNVVIPTPPDPRGLDLKDPNVSARYQNDLAFHYMMNEMATHQAFVPNVQRDAAGNVQVPPEPNPNGLNLKDPNVRLKFSHQLQTFQAAVEAAQANGQPIPMSSPNNRIVIPPRPSAQGLNLMDPNAQAQYQQALDFHNNMYVLANQQPYNFDIQRNAQGQVMVPPQPSSEGLNFRDPNVQLKFEHDVARYAAHVRAAEADAAGTQQPQPAIGTTSSAATAAPAPSSNGFGQAPVSSPGVPQQTSAPATSSPVSSAPATSAAPFTSAPASNGSFLGTSDIQIPQMPSSQGLNLKDPNVMAKYQEDMQFYTQMVQLRSKIAEMLHDTRKSIIQSMRA